MEEAVSVRRRIPTKHTLWWSSQEPLHADRITIIGVRRCANYGAYDVQTAVAQATCRLYLPKSGRAAPSESVRDLDTRS